MKNEKNGKFVDIKIRKKYRDILKSYCLESGDKMYIKVERLIMQYCNPKDTKNILKSEILND